MPKYMVYAFVTGTKYIGTFEATTKEEAEKMAWESQCSGEVEDPEIQQMEVEEIKEVSHE